MQRLFGTQVWVMYIMGLEVKQVPVSDRKCKEHGIAYSECYAEHTKWLVDSCYRTKEQITGWYADAYLITRDYLNILDSVKSVEDIHKMPQQGMFNGSCYNCSYHDFCHLFNRKPEAAEQMFERRPWSPLDGGEVLREG